MHFHKRQSGSINVPAYCWMQNVKLLPPSSRARASSSCSLCATVNCSFQSPMVPAAGEGIQNRVISFAICTSFHYAPCSQASCLPFPRPLLCSFTAGLLTESYSVPEHSGAVLRQSLRPHDSCWPQSGPPKKQDLHVIQHAPNMLLQLHSAGDDYYQRLPTRVPEDLTD